MSGNVIFERDVITSDGNTRTVRAKKFDDELRVYTIWGDVTNPESLAEMAQILAAEHNCERVKISL